MDVSDLSPREAVRASLALLPSRERRKLVIAAFLQITTSVLDVLGVVLLGLVAALGASTMGSVRPSRLINRVVDLFGVETWSTTSVLVLFGLVACAFLMAKSFLAMYIFRRVFRFLANRQTEVSQRLSRDLLSRPLLEIQQRSSQQITYALTDGVNIAIVSLLGSMVVGITETGMLLALGMTLLVFNPLVTASAVAFFGVIVVLMQRVLGRRMSTLGKTVGESSIASRALVLEALGTYREALVLNRLNHYVDRVADLRGVFSHATADSTYLNLLPKYLLETALVVGAIMLTLTQFLWSDPVSAIGTVTLFLAAATRILPSILRLQQAILGLSNSAGAALPTYELAAELAGGVPKDSKSRSLQVRPSAVREIQHFDTRIEVSDLLFSYPGTNRPAVGRVSFAAAAGSSLALVGPSGAGKSTLADLLMGVLTPDSGSVLLGGHSPSDAVAIWPGVIAYVPQNIYLADGTVRANVALGLPDELVDDDAVWTALFRAQLVDFVRTLPLELDSLVGENGTHLSGGQRQRLGLARALYTEPRLLVLDEATSALDAETEYAVTEVLSSLQGEVTTVVIAHRLSTILNSSVVLYLEDGVLISCGTFDEVRAAVPRLDRQAQLSGLWASKEPPEDVLS